MTKIDFKKTLKNLYAPSKDRFELVDVPPLQYVKVDGHGDPNTSPAYANALQWLYSTSYAMKFACKTTLDQDYVVPPLQGLWWADDPAAFVARTKEQWRWTMMIMVPDFVTSTMFENAVEKSRKKLVQPPASLRLEPLTEGPSLQIMHIGSYDNEGPTLAQLHDVEMPARGMTFGGPHHEIYLNDPRRTDPAKLKTILRQPVRPIA